MPSFLKDKLFKKPNLRELQIGVHVRYLEA